MFKTLILSVRSSLPISLAISLVMGGFKKKVIR
jgi:hypothetical protein